MSFPSKKRKRKGVHGFLKRSRISQKVLARRRGKKRWRLTV